MTTTSGSSVRFVWLAGDRQPHRCPATTTSSSLCLTPLHLQVTPDGYAYYRCPERHTHLRRPDDLA